MKNIDYTLYLVTDSSCGRDRFFGIVEDALQNGVTLLQLREKNMDGGEFYNEAKKLKELALKYKVPLIIDDRADIALASGADGVHVGQSDLPVKEARRIMGSGKIIGASVQTEDQAVKAMADGADYIGAGAAFPTSTKENAGCISMETLKGICSSVKIPVVAIGGINKGNAAALSGVPIAGISVVSAIMGAPAPGAAAAELKKRFLKARRL